MENSEALRIIRALADGLNPSSEETCKSESLLRHPQTIRALEKAVAALHSEVERKIGKRSLPRSAGKPWFPSEEELLCAEFDRGMSIRQIASLHGRTCGAVTRRLERLGKVPYRIAMDFSCPSGDAGESAKRPS